MSEPVEGGLGHIPERVAYLNVWEDRRLIVDYDERGTVTVTRKVFESLIAGCGFLRDEIGADGQPQP